MTQHRFELRGDFVELHALLKLLALASSGGAAGEVSVDGQTETRKACKIRAGQVVRVGEDEVRVE